jgi:hypothetical protein
MERIVLSKNDKKRNVDRTEVGRSKDGITAC